MKAELSEKKDKLKHVLIESQNAKGEIEEGKKKLEVFKVEAV